MGMTMDLIHYASIVTMQAAFYSFRRHLMTMRHLATFSPRCRIKGIFAFAASALLAASVFAQDKPPLKILVGFPPGGSVDILARTLGDAMRDDFSSVVVDNKPGAAGRIALMQTKAAKPDGQTVIVLPMGPMVIFPHTYKKLDYDALKDFTPVSQLAISNFGVVAGPSAGANSVSEMLAKVKADPKLGNYGTPGAGSVPHFLGVMMEQTTGVPLNHIPFQGGAPANTALLGGHIQYKFDVVSETVQLHRDGKVKILAVAGAKRDSMIPEVPTLKEQGVNIETGVWFAMYAPAGLPPDVLARLEKSVVTALRKKDTFDKLDKLGFDVTATSSRELGNIQRADLARWEKPIKATGVALD
jgi:tripartite-type tricarboxylate transporter receptor subunit TctC